MTIEALVTAYGYPALFIGTFVEGETVLVLAGLAVRQGYLTLPWVVFWSFLASLLSSQGFYFLGRTSGKRFLEKRKSWELRAAKVDRLLERYGVWLALGFRLLYGFRSVVPFVFGMSRMRPVTFLLINSAGAVLWATFVAGAGYLFGAALEAGLGKIEHYEEELLITILIAGAVFWVVHVIRLRRQCRPGRDTDRACR